LLLLLRPSLPLTPLERYGMVRRFATVAAWSVALLVLSGLVNTWFMTNSFRDLIGTDYGDLLWSRSPCLSSCLALPPRTDSG
jgi:putative copper export protein